MSVSTDRRPGMGLREHLLGLAGFPLGATFSDSRDVMAGMGCRDISDVLLAEGAVDALMGIVVEFDEKGRAVRVERIEKE